MLKFSPTATDDPERHAIAAEVTRRRFGNKNLDPEVLEQITEDHADRIENMFLAQLIEELTRRGRIDEFDRVTDDPNADTASWLAGAIPNFAEWRSNAIQTAVNKLLTGD